MSKKVKELEQIEELDDYEDFEKLEPKEKEPEIRISKRTGKPVRELSALQRETLAKAADKATNT